MKANDKSSGIAAENPPVELIRVAISRLIEADYEERGVFQDLRRPPEMANSNLASVHWCTPIEVEAVLQDADKRRTEAKSGLKSAYTTFINAVEQAAKNFDERRDWLSGTEPLRGYEGDRYRKVYVIPSQFASIDLPSSLKLPGTPGGPVRGASYKDRAGRRCTVNRAFYLSPRAYEVTIHFTKEELRERSAEKEAEKPTPKYNTAQEYRDKMVRTFTSLIALALPGKGENFGFTYEPCIHEALQRKMQEAEYMLRSARIVATAPQQAGCPSSPERRAVERPYALRLVHSATGTTT